MDNQEESEKTAEAKSLAYFVAQLKRDAERLKKMTAIRVATHADMIMDGEAFGIPAATMRKFIGAVACRKIRHIFIAYPSPDKKGAKDE